MWTPFWEGTALITGQGPGCEAHPGTEPQAESVGTGPLSEGEGCTLRAVTVLWPATRLQGRGPGARVCPPGRRLLSAEALGPWHLSAWARAEEDPPCLQNTSVPGGLRSGSPRRGRRQKALVWLMICYGRNSASMRGTRPPPGYAQLSLKPFTNESYQPTQLARMPLCLPRTYSCYFLYIAHPSNPPTVGPESGSGALLCMSRGLSFFI